MFSVKACTYGIAPVVVPLAVNAVFAEEAGFVGVESVPAVAADETVLVPVAVVGVHQVLVHDPQTAVEADVHQLLLKDSNMLKENNRLDTCTLRYRY